MLKKERAHQFSDRPLESGCRLDTDQIHSILPQDVVSHQEKSNLTHQIWCLGTSDRNSEAKKSRRGRRLSNDPGPIRGSAREKEISTERLVTCEGKAAGVSKIQGEGDA